VEDGFVRGAIVGLSRMRKGFIRVLDKLMIVVVIIIIASDRGNVMRDYFGNFIRTNYTEQKAGIIIEAWPMVLSGRVYLSGTWDYKKQLEKQTDYGWE
jgi:hypothetical protein